MSVSLSLRVLQKESRFISRSNRNKQKSVADPGSTAVMSIRSGSEGSSDEGQEAQRREERLREVFETNPGATRYEWEGKLGAGANGAVYKVKRGTQRIAVKLVPDTIFGGTGDGDDDDDGDDDIDEALKALDNEADWLQVRLRGGSF